MNVCEYCNVEILIIYGSGRFCSSKCSHGFSTRNKRKEINEKLSIKSKEYGQTEICKATNKARALKSWANPEFRLKMEKSINKRFPNRKIKNEIEKLKIPQNLKVKCIACDTLTYSKKTGYCRKCYVNLHIQRQVQCNTGGYREGSGYSKSGYYKGIFCSSTYELVFLIYNLDNGIDIKRYSGYYTYQYNNVTHKYFPDFIIDNTIYEIKGRIVDIDTYKWNSVTDKKLIIIDKNNIQFYRKYVSKKYNISIDKLYKLYDK